MIRQEWICCKAALQTAWIWYLFLFSTLKIHFKVITFANLQQTSSLHSPWSRTAPSLAGWLSSWRCWACWGTSPTLWTWLIRWTGCGGSTQTHRSLQWSPCPGWWSGLPLMSFWSVKRREGAKKLMSSLQYHYVTISVYTETHSTPWKPLSIPRHTLKFRWFLTRWMFPKIKEFPDGSKWLIYHCVHTHGVQRWTVSDGNARLSCRLLRSIFITTSSCQQFFSQSL